MSTSRTAVLCSCTGNAFNRRFLTAEIEVSKEISVFLTCLHLNHKLEPIRLQEIDNIRHHLEPVFKENQCQIWTGDFNALTREDYSDDEWQKITAIRAKNHWELPKTGLTTQVKKYGFKDCWTIVGCPKPFKTCRFNTHIDYIYANEAMLDKAEVISVTHIEDSASDHNMVLAKFKIK